MTVPVDPTDAYQSGLMDKILAELKHSVRQEHYETWFRGISLRRIEGERYVFGVPSGFVRDWLRKNYLTLIESAVRSSTGRRRCEVVLELGRGSRQQAIVPDPVPDPDPELGPPTAPKTSGPAAFRTAADAGESAGESSRGDPSAAVGPDPATGTPGRSRERSGRHGGAVGPRDAAGFHPIPTAPADAESAGGRHLGARSGRAASRGVGSAGWDRLADLGELNRSYTFDQFVVGPCNRLSHAASLAVAENPGRAYNPLFIHGNVGLGKTHLLQAICHEIRRKDESARVLYMSCEEFTNRFIHAIQVGRLDEFREFHRNVDVIVVDDVQFLANKDKTQDEFFHTFNALYNTNRQIIISSDRSPSDIPTIEERLVSRFRWGLVAEMEVPCFETRVAIARRKAKLRQLELPEDVAYFIAKRIDTNIRELEGAVVKVVGVASITDRDVSVELAEEALRGVVVQRSRQVSVSEIMGLVADEFSITARDLTGKSRTQAISLPRQIGMYLCRQLTDQSLEEIGRYFGRRDHTTVLYAVKKIENRVKDDRMFRELVGALSTRLHG